MLKWNCRREDLCFGDVCVTLSQTFSAAETLICSTDELGWPGLAEICFQPTNYFNNISALFFIEPKQNAVEVVTVRYEQVLRLFYFILINNSISVLVGPQHHHVTLLITELLMEDIQEVKSESRTCSVVLRPQLWSLWRMQTLTGADT